jgi:hypothetical protein
MTVTIIDYWISGYTATHHTDTTTISPSPPFQRERIDYAIQNQILSIRFLGTRSGHTIASNAALPVCRSASLDLMKWLRLMMRQKR